jgi:hypothetical protein
VREAGAEVPTRAGHAGIARKLIEDGCIKALRVEKGLGLRTTRDHHARRTGKHGSGIHTTVHLTHHSFSS